MVNKFDDVRLDIVALLQAQEVQLPAYQPEARSADGLGLWGKLKSRLILLRDGVLVKLGIHKRLVFSNWRLDWFYEFYDYWVHELGNRTLFPHDFYYLYDNYRQKAYSVEVANDATDEDHLKAWQDYRNIWAIFMYHYILAVAPFAYRRYIDYIPDNSRVLEFGCGLAPAVTMLSRYYRHKNLHLTAADLPAVMFHYVRWKFRKLPFVRPYAIDPASDTPLDERYDVITCLTVFEHLQRPLAIAQHFYEQLNPRGYLIFDYVITEGEHLDTQAAQDQRMDVLQFITDHFVVRRGTIHMDGRPVYEVVCQKR